MKIKSFQFILALLSIALFACEDEYVKPVKIVHQQQAIDTTLSLDKELDNYIQPYREKIDAEMQTVLSYSPNNMFKTDSKYNTAIGNMMADAVLEEANPLFKEKHNTEIDAVLLNFGGIRSGISKGDITVKTAFDIMPFENEVIVVELPYEAAQEMIAYLIDKKTAHPIAGMQIKLNHNYSLKSAFINGEEIKLYDKKDKSFYIATSDYLLQGGDNMDFFAKNKNVFQLDYKLRNLFIDHFEKKEKIEAKQDQRFTVGK